MSNTHQEKTLAALKAARKLLRGAGTAASREAYRALSKSITSVGYEIDREKENDKKYDELMQIGKRSADALREMVAALQCDYDRLEELRQMKEERDTNIMDSDEVEELAELEKAAGECTSEEEARIRIHEDALEVSVRSDWQSMSETLTPSEFIILLSTGGPAVRIIGELRDGSPCTASLQVQDWFQPWTEYSEEGLSDVLLAYAGCFYFGE